MTEAPNTSQIAWQDDAPPSSTAPVLAFSVCVIDSDDIADRIPRRLQSSVASDLLSAMKAQAPFATVHSKSHSRALVAIAIGNLVGLRLGIDIEWTGARRPIRSIASYLQWEERDPITPCAFYRGWTFAEAYYKAFQQRPEKSLVVHAMREISQGHVTQLDGGVGVLQNRILRDFQLSLVWKCADLQPVPPNYMTQLSFDRSGTSVVALND